MQICFDQNRGNASKVKLWREIREFSKRVSRGVKSTGSVQRVLAEEYATKNGFKSVALFAINIYR